MNTTKLLHRTKQFLQTHAKKESGLVTLFVVLFLIGSGILFGVVGRGLDPDAGKDWWALAFVSPKSASLSFVIENHGSGTAFSYSVVKPDKTIIDSGTVDIAKGSSRIVNESVPAVTDEKTVVTVTDANGKKKDIYRQ